MRLDLQSQKTISLYITKTISLNIQIDIFVCRSDLGTTTLISFPSKNLKYTATRLFSQILSKLIIVKFTISTRTDITLQASVNYLKAITMCSAFTPDFRYDNSILKPIGNVYCVYCPNTMCSDILCVHNKTFQSLSRSDYPCLQCESTCHRRKILFEEHTNSFFLKFRQGVCILEETKKSFRAVIGDAYCPTCPNEKCIYFSTNKFSSF